MSLDVQRVKEYNRQLKECKEKSSKITAEMEFNRGEIQRLCTELTNQLGIEVTPENVVSIYKEREAKLENTLATGEEILKRIKEEEESIDNNLSGVSSPVGMGMTMGTGTDTTDGFSTYKENINIEESELQNMGNNVNTVNGEQFIQPIFKNII